MSIATPMATASPCRRREVGHHLQLVGRPVAEVQRPGLAGLERVAAARDVVQVHPAEARITGRAAARSRRRMRRRAAAQLVEQAARPSAATP